MKKLFLLPIIPLFFMGLVIADEQKINAIISNEELNIGLLLYENSPNLAGIITFENGHINSYGNGTFSIIINPEYIVHEDFIEIYFSNSNFRNFLDKDFKYFIWTFPKRYKLNLSYQELIQTTLSWNHSIDIRVNTLVTYPTTCQAIVIDNLNIRDEPTLNGNKIGQLEKRREVTLYEQSKHQDELDGEKNPWYKVKLDENTYGWVYGGYVRIFFEDPELGYSDKELILKSIE